MAFQEVSTKIIKLHEEQFINKPLTGYYLGSKRSDKYENSRIHKFQNKKDGKFVSIYGAGQLNYLLAEVSVGSLVRVTYTGVVKLDTKYGKNKDVHQYKVEVDPDDVLTPQRLAAVQVEAHDEDEESDFEESTPKKSGKDQEDDLPF